MSSSFNLIDSPWIPVRWLGGRQEDVGLAPLFANAASMADLSVAPHERVALTRLLVCITQAALGAPADYYGWNDFGAELEEKTGAYLARNDISSSFTLFGDAPRFLQTQITRGAEPVAASKLYPRLATGNNPTLLDHEGAEARVFSPRSLALALLTFQCFYPLYGAGYKGKGPCVDSNMAHAIPLGRTLRETILLNCLDQETIDRAFPGLGLGRPIWEMEEKAEDFGSVATGSYLGRLVPRHRNIWLLDDGTRFLIDNGGFQYPTFDAAREPSATVIVVKDKPRLLPLRLERAVWRDLHAITVIRHYEKAEAGGAPLPLSSHSNQFAARDAVIWVGGMITDLKAKILDTTESIFSLPPSMLTEAGRDIYAGGIEFAETRSRMLWSAVTTYAATLKSEAAPTERALRHYWNALEQQAPILLEFARDPAPLTGKPFGAGPDEWSVAVRAAAQSAYGATCPRLTPRQLHAFAEGQKRLWPRPKKSRKGVEATAGRAA